MKRFQKSFAFLFSFLFLLSLSACTKSSDSNPDEVDERTGERVAFRTDCGTVFQGNLQNPVRKSDGLEGELISVVSSNLIALRTSDGTMLLKLHGISNDVSNNQEGVSFLERIITEESTVYVAERDCGTTLDDGTKAMVGQVFSEDGESASEELLVAGFGAVDTGDVCGSEMITGCYQALAEIGATISSANAAREESSETAGTDDSGFDLGEIPTERPRGDGSSSFGGSSGNFLWKPNSENDGNLVILFSFPKSVQSVKVGGESGRFTGASNGRTHTYRFRKPGCSYQGATVVITATDGSKTRVNIGNGCNRVEKNSI